MFKRRLRWPAWSPFRRKPGGADCLIGDSKMLSEEQRETAYAWIVTHCAYGVASVSADDIDAFGILAATERAMQEAVRMLAARVTPGYLLVDGKDAFWFDYPHSSVVRGDSSEPCIAAASIIAKVTRDRWMKRQALLFPQYGFDKHKGYGSDMHREAIRVHGPCALHRKSFLSRVLAPLSAPDAA
jgi:ribonuclease HII